ncbi:MULTISPECIES: exodeoxyribonuclease III [Paraburkholderia]|uniref:Exodeoxyribonuclease III n=1 Tax=Paraburkholderia megapolitana TaxID=420953 RepID=A0A1I3NQG8_9BURK|nr:MULTISPECIES: exodeoxyribonuclease III [Paraburkholderia]MCX4162247.1 exodeoxyribonuclease III [Paraburkholderia megapolitana]MDN7157742.1 exodeoxyribonuclease III [Paraburkholderia sp. CHISQ3]MDQ6494789.1 exodeoxyribonuclease III [Paraburkholderia megapolitana]QDQ84465.1 exodeoxyribonuclease III [Paraburkholderia megapolitana]SFJ11525.1 Exodeoxyribonuclease III [Paraburkholderia megapolitana]
MKIATWNVNSLKVRQQHVLDWLETSQTDVLCLQELKMPDEKFPRAEFEAKGYRSWFAGQKTYNGVAILVRDGLNVDDVSVVRNIPGFEDPQQRVIAATIEGARVISAYFPNGQAPGTEKFAYKLSWLAALHTWLVQELAQYPKLALLGDYNIAPDDRDVHDPQAWEGQNLVSPEERAAFVGLIELGLVDAFRLFDQPDKAFSWWDYRMLAFRRNAGLRIDHILLSKPLAAACTFCDIDKTPRKWDQPSDHTPVVAQID